MQRPLALGLALCLLAGLGWLGTSLLSDESPARAASPGALPRAAAPAMPAAELAAPAADRQRPAADAPALAADVGERVELREQAAPGTRVECTLRVVDRSSGEAVAGARVDWTALGPDEVAREHPAWDLERCDAWLAEHGREAESAADGTLAIEFERGCGAIALARVPGKAARAQVAAEGDGAVELALVPDADLEVLVGDTAGAPLEGVVVALLDLGQTWGRGLSSNQRTSDAQGRARYAHLGLRVDLLAKPWGVGTPDVLDGPPSVPLDPAALPREPLRFTLPSTGVVEVEVRPPPGLTLPEHVAVALLLDEGVEDERLSFWTRPDSVETSLQDGRARFAHVALGRDLIVEAGAGYMGIPTRARVRGPEQAGQVVRVALTLGQDHPLLRARLVGVDGRPLAEHGVSWRLDEGNGMDNEARADAQGVVVLHLSPHEAEGRGRTLHLTVAAGEGRAGGVAEIDVPDALPTGPTDLGDVHVAAGTPLVAGVVVGPDGARRAGAEVRVEAVTSWGEDNRYFEDLELGVVTAEDGTFVAWGANPGRGLRVTALHDGLTSRSLECPVGRSGLVLELLASGTVAGRVLLDEGLDASDLDVRLQPTGDDRNDWFLRGRADLDREGRFGVGGLRPGSYDLWLDGPGGGTGVLALAGLEVPAGGPCRDPRLKAIDLRGRVLALRVRLRTPEPGQALMGTVRVRPVRDGAPAEEEGETEFLQGNELRLLLDARAVDLTVDVQGYRRVELRDVRGDVEVELRRGLPVRLRIPADVALPAPPKYLKAYLAPGQDESLAYGHFLDVVFDERREILLHAPAAGRLRVGWLLEERAEGMLSTSNLGAEPAAFVEVLDVEAEQFFDVEPPREALADRLRDD